MTSPRGRPTALPDEPPPAAGAGVSARPDLAGGPEPAKPGASAARPGPGAVVTGQPGEPSTARRGSDLARAALESARSATRSREPERARWRRVAGQRRANWSGSGADPRDPQPFGASIQRLVADRGWERQTAEASVLARWGHLVGAGIAEHSQPVSLHDGALIVAAESTAWATQLRLLAPRILQRLRAELGPDIVTTLRVHGPTAPSWKKGPRSVRGRGPRDTYG